MKTIKTETRGPKNCIRGIDKHSVNFKPALTIAWEDMSGQVPVRSTGTYLGSLIAAAPDLYEFIKDLADQRCYEEDGEFPDDGESGIAPCLSCRARAAIAKAEGK